MEFVDKVYVMSHIENHARVHIKTFFFHRDDFLKTMNKSYHMSNSFSKKYSRYVYIVDIFIMRPMGNTLKFLVIPTQSDN